MADPAGNDNQVLLQRAISGDESALAALFDGYRDRLRRMIRLRLDRRLSGRVDSSGPAVPPLGRERVRFHHLGFKLHAHSQLGKIPWSQPSSTYYKG